MTQLTVKLYIFHSCALIEQMKCNINNLRGVDSCIFKRLDQAGHFPLLSAMALSQAKIMYSLFKMKFFGN